MERADETTVLQTDHSSNPINPTAILSSYSKAATIDLIPVQYVYDHMEDKGTGLGMVPESAGALHGCFRICKYTHFRNHKNNMIGGVCVSSVLFVVHVKQFNLSTTNDRLQSAS